MTYRLGTRGSLLARRQAELIREQLGHCAPDVEWTIVPITASADQRPEAPLATISGEGIFVKELEHALLRDDIDLAVHSLKDIPLEGSPPALVMAAIPEREEPHDALVSREGHRLMQLPHRARLGSSSLRRQSQLLHLRPDLEIVPIRGNVDTRLKQLETERLDGVVVAAAGLMRLGLQHRISDVLHALIPEPGQGALAVQIRQADTALHEMVRALDDAPTRLAVETERHVLRALGGGCRVPIGALAEIRGGTMRLQGVVASPDGKRLIRREVMGPAETADRMATQLAEQLCVSGAREILSARSSAG